MRQDVRKCFFVGVLCLWLFWDAIGIVNPTVGTEKYRFKEQEEGTGREILSKEELEWGDLTIYLNKSRHLNIHIVWIAKGCILFLTFSVLKRTQ